MTEKDSSIGTNYVEQKRLAEDRDESGRLN